MGLFSKLKKLQGKTLGGKLVNKSVGGKLTNKMLGSGGAKKPKPTSKVPSMMDSEGMGARKLRQVKTGGELPAKPVTPGARMSALGGRGLNPKAGRTPTRMR
jgi:hypothetical protein